MLLRTHVIFTAAVLALLGAALSSPLLAWCGVPISFLANYIIDGFGHTRRRWGRRLYVSRTPLTHTPTHSAVAGALAAIPVAAALYFYSYPSLAPAAVALGAVAGLSHVFLDAFTEAGIFVKRGGTYRRAAIAHLTYNNAAANTSISILSLLVAAAVLLHALQTPGLQGLVLTH